MVLLEIPYCLKNESSSKQFIKTFEEFTDDKFDMGIRRLTKKVKTWFKVKDKSLHQACKIHKGTYSCGESYIGETVRNVELCCNKHNNPMKTSNQWKHIKDYVNHVLNWPVLGNAPKNKFQQKVLEVCYIILDKSLLLTDYLIPRDLF